MHIMGAIGIPVPIAIAIWAVVTLMQIRTTQRTIDGRLAAIEQSLRTPK